MSPRRKDLESKPAGPAEAQGDPAAEVESSDPPIEAPEDNPVSETKTVDGRRPTRPYFSV